MGIMGKLSNLFLIVALGLSFGLDALAAKRVARFFTVGVNSTKTPFVNTKIPVSACTIVIRNPSNYEQKYQIVDKVVQADESSTGVTLIGSEAGTILAQKETVIIWEYPPHSGLAGDQILTCGASIVAWDSKEDERGFLVGSGSLSVFTRSGKTYTEKNAAGTDRGSWELDATETFQQIQIFVGEGHPF